MPSDPSCGTIVCVDDQAEVRRLLAEVFTARGREVVSFDFAALTSYDPQQGRHAVVALAGVPHLAVGAGPLLARAFPDNSGLCAMALKNRAVLPASEAPPQEPLVFDEETRLSRVGSLLVLPLQATALWQWAMRNRDGTAAPAAPVTPKSDQLLN